MSDRLPRVLNVCIGILEHGLEPYRNRRKCFCDIIPTIRKPFSDPFEYVCYIRVGFRESVRKPFPDVLEDLLDPRPDIRKQFLDINAESFEESDNERNPRLNDVLCEINDILKGFPDIIEESVEIALQ